MLRVAKFSTEHEARITKLVNRLQQEASVMLETLRDLEEDIGDYVRLGLHAQVLDVCRIYEHHERRKVKWTIFSSDVFTPG